MNKPKIFKNFSIDELDFCEKSSSTPDECFVPGQAIRLSELVARFERGQRLNVHLYNSNIVSEDTPDERFDDAPPEDIQDIVDVDAYNRSLKERKRDLQSRKKVTPKDKNDIPKDEPSGEE